MKARNLASKLWTLLWVAVWCVTLTFVTVTPVTTTSLQPQSTTDVITAPSYLFNRTGFNYDMVDGTSILADLGVVRYNQFLMDLQNSQGQALPEVVVAVLDSGVDADHAVFGENRERLLTDYAVNFCLQIEDATGRPVSSGLTANDWDSDASGHGTHVAGIIADSTLANVKILPIRIFCGTDNTMGLNTFNNAVNYLCALKEGKPTYLNGYWYNTQRTKLNIVAVNLSLGTTGIEAVKSNDDLLTRTNRDYQSYINSLCGAAILPIAAAGNISKDNGETNTKSYYSFPASCAGAVSVSAYDFYNDYDLADFSYYNNCVSISAPGVGIWSACSDDVYDRYSKRNQTYVDPGTGIKYLQLSGTSMATPFVTICYALLMSDPTKTTAATLGIDSWDPTVDYARPYYYVTMQEKALLLHALDLYEDNEPGMNDPYYGYGGINVEDFAQATVAVQTSKTAGELLVNNVNTQPVVGNDTLAGEVSEWGTVVWILVGVGLIFLLINMVKSAFPLRRGEE